MVSTCMQRTSIRGLEARLRLRLRLKQVGSGLDLNLNLNLNLRLEARSPTFLSRPRSWRSSLISASSGRLRT